MDILNLKGISKIFQNGKIIANNNIDLDIRQGEIHSIVGENGAGKTTLISLMMGFKQPSSGEIFWKGKEEFMKSSHYANSLGLGLVPQHVELVESMSVWENVTLGNEIKRRGMLDKNESIDRVNKLIKKYSFSLEAKTKVRKLTLSQKQKVLILKALYTDSELIIFDEPTSVLSINEIQELLKSIKELKKDGKTIVFISHKLKEVLSISDNITVIRRGKKIKTVSSEEANVSNLTDLIMRKKLGKLSYKNPNKPSKEVLIKISNLGTYSTKSVTLKGINIEIHKGEVLGILGVEGNGQSQFIKSLLQRKKKINKESSIVINGQELMQKTSSDILHNFISLIPEDRHEEGLFLDGTIFDNFFISNIDTFTKWGFLNKGKQRKFVDKLISEYSVRGAQNTKAKVSSLSGGNQQKIIVARELARETNLLIAHKPTSGVDVGAIKTIYEKLFEYTSKGNSAIVISDEIEEVLQVSHKVAVFYHGEIMGIVPTSTSLKVLGRMMLGEKYESI